MLITELVFLSDNLVNPANQRNLQLPLEFLSFAFCEAHMYKQINSKNTFLVKKGTYWGNQVVYGGLFLLRDFHFYIRTLDALHACSKSMLGRNHDLDLQHRILCPVTPILFHDVEQFKSLRYREKEQINAYVYVGNLKHPKIQQRVVKSRRIVQGINDHYIHLIREVFQHDR